MKHVLLLTHHLENFAGSEINIYELAITLQELGYSVEIGTFIYGNPIKNLFQKDKLIVKNLFEDKLCLDNYDLIWAQHSPTLNYVLFELSVISNRIIFSSLSPYEPLEVTPLYLDRLISCYLANSEETKKQMIREGVNQDKIKVQTNSLITEFFNHEKKSYNKEVKKIAVVSNHIPSEIYDFKIISENNNFKVDLYGLGNKVVFITPKILLEYDLIITIGKTVQMGLSLGIPIYIYDHFGGDGWVTPQNIDLLEQNNFSGRSFQKKFSGEMLFNEINSNYQIVLKDIDKLKYIARNRYSLKKNIEEIIYSSGNKVNITLLNELYIVHRTVKYYTRLLQNFIHLTEDYKNLSLKKEQELNEINQELQEKKEQFERVFEQLQKKEQQFNNLQEVIESMKIKNRIKKIFKFIKSNVS